MLVAAMLSVAVGLATGAIAAPQAGAAYWTFYRDTICIGPGSPMLSNIGECQFLTYPPSSLSLESIPLGCTCKNNDYCTLRLICAANSLLQTSYRIREAMVCRAHSWCFNRTVHKPRPDRGLDGCEAILWLMKSVLVASESLSRLSG